MCCVSSLLPDEGRKGGSAFGLDPQHLGFPHILTVLGVVNWINWIWLGSGSAAQRFTAAASCWMAPGHTFAVPMDFLPRQERPRAPKDAPWPARDGDLSPLPAALRSARRRCFCAEIQGPKNRRQSWQWRLAILKRDRITGINRD